MERAALVDGRALRRLELARADRGVVRVRLVRRVLHDGAPEEAAEDGEADGADLRAHEVVAADEQAVEAHEVVEEGVAAVLDDAAELGEELVLAREVEVLDERPEARELLAEDGKVLAHELAHGHEVREAAVHDPAAARDGVLHVHREHGLAGLDLRQRGAWLPPHVRGLDVVHGDGAGRDHGPLDGRPAHGHWWLVASAGAQHERGHHGRLRLRRAGHAGGYEAAHNAERLLYLSRAPVLGRLLLAGRPIRN